MIEQRAALLNIANPVYGKVDYLKRQRRKLPFIERLRSYEIISETNLSSEQLRALLMQQEISLLRRIHSWALDSNSGALCSSMSLHTEYANNDQCFRDAFSYQSFSLSEDEPFYELGFAPYGVSYKLEGRGKLALIMGLDDLNSLRGMLPSYAESDRPGLVVAHTNVLMANAVIKYLRFGLSRMSIKKLGLDGLQECPLEAEEIRRVFPAKVARMRRYPRASFWNEGANVEVFTTTENLLSTEIGERLETFRTSLCGGYLSNGAADYQDRVLREARIDAILYLSGFIE